MKNIFAYILSGLITLSLSAQTVSSDAGDFAAQAKLEVDNGISMDINYALTIIIQTKVIF